MHKQVMGQKDQVSHSWILNAQDKETADGQNNNHTENKSGKDSGAGNVDELYYL